MANKKTYLQEKPAIPQVTEAEFISECIAAGSTEESARFHIAASRKAGSRLSIRGKMLKLDEKPCEPITMSPTAASSQESTCPTNGLTSKSTSLFE